MPDLYAHKEHENLILQHMTLLLTGRFVSKVFPYIRPMPGKTRIDVFNTLIIDVLKVATMAMEMSKPEPDAPKDFDECFANAHKRVCELLKASVSDWSEEARVELNNNWLTLNKIAEVGDMVQDMLEKPHQS